MMQELNNANNLWTILSDSEKTVGKFVCIGLNYSDHAEETGMEIPPEPVIFFKATSAIVGPDDDVIIPKKSVKSDWEVELGIVIGKEAKYINENESQDHIAGYCVINDLSEREFQLEKSGQFIIGKSAPSFGPIGPFLVTPDEIVDVKNLNMKTTVNGKIMQNGNTKDMIHSINHVIAYLSTFIKLQRGDLIIFGTPDGVGAGIKPNPVFLKDGDMIELEIEGLGKQKHKVIDQN